MRPLKFALISLAYAILLAGGGPAHAQGGSWAGVADMPTPRRLLAAAAEGGNLYTFGGCGSPCFGPPFHTSTNEETTVEVYLPKEGRWERKKRMPTILFGAAAAAPGNGKIYTFGGYVSGNVVQEYDPKNDSWKIKRPMPTPRHGLAAVALGGKIYVLGGSGPSAALEIYDPVQDTWTRGAPMPTPRVFLSAAVLDGKIYALGGSPDCCGNSQTDAVEIYDPMSDRWEAGPSLPGARQVSAAVSLDGKIYVFGGFIPGVGVQADTLIYDSRTRRWTFGTPLPVAKDQAPAVLIGSRVFIPGGSVDCHCEALDRTDRFEPDTPPHLVCEKDLKGPASVTAGEIVTYTIRVENPGPVAVAGVTLIDPPTEGLVPVGETQCGTDEPCDLGTLAPGTSRSVDVKFQVTAAGSCDRREITNVARVSAASVDAVECRALPISILGSPVGPVVLCEKSAPNPLSAKAGDVVTYEVEVTNIGCGAAQDVMLFDEAPEGLVFEGVGEPCEELPCSLETLDPEDFRRVEVKFRVLEGCRSPVDNIARVTHSTGDDAECSSPVPAAPAEADLGVEVSAPGSVSGGTSFPLVVQVENAGPAIARNGMLSVDIQGAGSVTSITDCKLDPDIAGRFTCTLGDLACGANQEIPFQVQAPACHDCAEAPGPITVKADVKSETLDPNPLNNSDSDEVQVECQGEVCLAIDKTDFPDPVAPGGELTYTIKVENVGSVDADGVCVKDVTPPELGEIQWCQEGRNCPPAPRGPLDVEIDLAAGASKIFRLRGIAPLACGTLLNTASAEHPLAKKVEDEEETQVAGLSLLCQNIEGDFVEGSIVTYTFVLANCGPADQMDNPGDELTNTLPAGLTLVSAAATSGTVATNLGTNTTTWNGVVLAGDTVTITIQATIDLGTAGTTICNQATGSFDLDGNGANETILLSDDPHTPGGPDPCCFPVLDEILPIPTLSETAAVALALLLAALSLRRLRRPSAGR